MKKVLFLAAATAAIVSSCSQSAESVIEDNDNNIETSQTPVNMSVYTASSTRAGDTGNIDDVNALVAKGGFGVFAYQTGTYNYENTENKKFKPDFMYNQVIEGSIGTDKTVTWHYSPIKYWPNDNTVADDARAKGETNTGKVSFFAYAPYTSETVSANETSGITGFSGNNDSGDPTVSYKLTTNGTANVDLLLGTAETNTSAAKTNGTTVSGSAQNGKTLTGGQEAVNVDLTKMKNNGRILFVFKHALAKFGGYDKNNTYGILIKADPDIVDNADASTLGHSTKITVKNITITTDSTSTTITNKGQQQLATSGKLNLATGVWTLDKDSQDDTKVKTEAATLKTVINYTQKDGVDALLNADIAEPTSKPAAETSETTKSFFDGKGVQKSPINVYASEANPFVFIPGTKIPSMKVTVVYVVRTKDSKVVNGYTETTNKITKVISFGGTEGKEVQMNKRYTLTIILGISGLKFDATVSNWTNATTTGSDGKPTADNTDINLPINVTDTTSSNGSSSSSDNTSSSSSSENTGSTTNGK